jgi:fructosamine-3-kinase
VPVHEALLADLCRALGIDAAEADVRPVAGGDSHAAARLETRKQRWFIKWDAAARLGQFEAELEALRILSVADGPILPDGVCAGSNGTHAWLVTGWLDLQPTGDAPAFGTRLAAMHRRTQDCFGWHADNVLGASRQDNRPHDSWPEFWWSRRLAPQLERALASGLAPGATPETLRAASDQLLSHRPPPALVHGDLWGGNHAFLADGSPVIFDPAPYYGDRETDLAMMRLFGGFHPSVFEAYEGAWPLSPGSRERLPLYQLYHLLNHYNLFGSGWASRVTQSLRATLRCAEQA